MAFPAVVLFMLTALASTHATAQSTLNKCIDARGAVTYTNKPCGNARESKIVEIDPAPEPDRPRVAPVQVQPAKPATAKPLPSPASPSIHLETQHAPMGGSTHAKSTQQGSAKQCDTLADKLGRVLDKMDQSRRKGYTQAQMDGWNEEVRELERKKQQSGCF